MVTLFKLGKYENNIIVLMILVV